MDNRLSLLLLKNAPAELPKIRWLSVYISHRWAIIDAPDTGHQLKACYAFLYRSK